MRRAAAIGHQVHAHVGSAMSVTKRVTWAWNDPRHISNWRIQSVDQVARHSGTLEPSRHLDFDGRSGLCLCPRPRNLDWKLARRRHHGRNSQGRSFNSLSQEQEDHSRLPVDAGRFRFEFCDLANRSTRDKRTGTLVFSSRQLSCRKQKALDCLDCFRPTADPLLESDRFERASR